MRKTYSNWSRLNQIHHYKDTNQSYQRKIQAVNALCSSSCNCQRKVKHYVEE